ncbi:putative methyltransferase-domain-containing protein [Xylariaceae sp. FL1272]|nr:putative methyltransferase-domain-containing protein [Xylariaceae sp. FL1272]
MAIMTATSIDPADFPQVWERPIFEDLIACLEKLHLKPPIWNSTAPSRTALENNESSARTRREVTSYLSSIVSSGLSWIDDDDQKERVWDEASRCLSERCGRAGMGEINRIWPFEKREKPFQLVVREPPITGDSLGHKTWCSSYLMAQLLDEISTGPFSHLLCSTRAKPAKVLELGSGTGLLGMAAAAMWQTGVVLSDLPIIMTNLNFNIEQNKETIEGLGGRVSSGTLTWGTDNGNDAMFIHRNQFDIILAADGIYDDDHPVLLSSAIQSHMHRSSNSRALVMTPIRDQITRDLIARFRLEMDIGGIPLTVLEEHTLIGQDDWGSEDGSAAVECWWAIFGSNQTNGPHRLF